jgi:hypothetical protein
MAYKRAVVVRGKRVSIECGIVRGNYYKFISPELRYFWYKHLKKSPKDLPSDFFCLTIERLVCVIFSAALSLWFERVLWPRMR